MINNHLVLETKIGNEVHNASYPTYYSKREKKTAQCKLYWVCKHGSKCYLLCTTEALTLHTLHFKKQAYFYKSWCPRAKKSIFSLIFFPEKESEVLFESLGSQLGSGNSQLVAEGEVNYRLVITKLRRLIILV